MTLIRLEPARELQGLQRDFNRLFGSVFDSPTLPGGAGRDASRRWIPAIDVIEADESYLLRADLPGLAPQEVSIELDDNTLTISGERSREQEESKHGYRRIERVSGSFSRALRLPDGVDPDSVQANFEHGVLEVRIPKPQQRKPVRVRINQAVGEAGQESQSD